MANEELTEDPALSIKDEDNAERLNNVFVNGISTPQLLF